MKRFKRSMAWGNYLRSVLERVGNSARELINLNTREKIKPSVEPADEWAKAAVEVREIVRRANRKAVAALRYPPPQPNGLRKFLMLEIEEQKRLYGRLPRRFYLNAYSLALLQQECSPAELQAIAYTREGTALWAFQGVELCIHMDFVIPVGETYRGEAYWL